jgi:hypothetical protein
MPLCWYYTLDDVRRQKRSHAWRVASGFQDVRRGRASSTWLFFQPPCRLLWMQLSFDGVIMAWYTHGV